MSLRLEVYDFGVGPLQYLFILGLFEYWDAQKVLSLEPKFDGFEHLQNDSKLVVKIMIFIQTIRAKLVILYGIYSDRYIASVGWWPELYLFSKLHQKNNKN